MFRKLLKYDLKALFRVLFPGELIVIALCVVASLVFSLLVSIQQSDGAYTTATLLETMVLTMFLYLCYMMLYAGLIAGSVYIMVFFYKKMVGSESYLTHTLPVKTDALLLSKLLASFIASLSMLVSVLLGGAVFGTITYFCTDGTDEFLWNAADQIKDMFDALFSQGDAWGLVISALVFILAIYICTMLLYFLSIVTGGTLARKHKALASIGMYCAFSFGMQIVTCILYYGALIVGATADYQGDVLNILDMSTGILLVLSVLYLLLAVLFYFLIRRMITKKLNL
ncbi:MAG TPA: hypothetical protein PLT66_06555 [Bacillota bacterium]|nr:hypothetical protein [Bacillota bacterium]